MSFELTALYLLYPLVGIFTVCTLARYKMRVATVVYLIAFFVLFLFLPVYAGNDLLRTLFLDPPADFSFAFFRDVTCSAFENITAYMTMPFYIAILLSVFLCLSAVSIAITAIRFVRKLRLRRQPYRSVFHRSIKKIGVRRRIPKTYRFCQTFCRFNC